MKRVHIIGRKNHGKTTLVAELVEHFTAQGLRVGTIKHTHHAHELDTPGKDSHTHRMAGASVVGILSRSMSAVFWPALPSDGERGGGDDRYEEFAPHFASCELVIVEGDTQTSGLKVEVWRAAAGSPPMAADDPTVAAIVTDDPVEATAERWPRCDVPAVGRNILQLLGIAKP